MVFHRFDGVCYMDQVLFRCQDFGQRCSLRGVYVRLYLCMEFDRVALSQCGYLFLDRYRVQNLLFKEWSLH